MLMGAAKYLAVIRNFDDTAVVVFRPAGGASGKALVEDGPDDTLGNQEVYGTHNAPVLPAARCFATRRARCSGSGLLHEGQGQPCHRGRRHPCCRRSACAAIDRRANLDPMKSPANILLREALYLLGRRVCEIAQGEFSTAESKPASRKTEDRQNVAHGSRCKSRMLS
jgi:hypothetical protein